MEGLLLPTHRGGLTVAGKQLRRTWQNENPFPKRLHQPRELHWGVGVPWAAREDGVAHQPAVTGEFYAYTARSVPSQVMYTNTTVAKVHGPAIVELKVREDGQKLGIRWDHANRGPGRLPHFGQSRRVVRVTVCEEDGNELSAGDGTQQCARIGAWIDRQRLAGATEYDVRVGLVGTHTNAQNVHGHCVAGRPEATGPKARVFWTLKRNSLCC